MFARSSRYCSLSRRPILLLRCCLQTQSHRGLGRGRVRSTAASVDPTWPFRDVRLSYGGRIAALTTTTSDAPTSSSSANGDDDKSKKLLDNRSRLGIGGSKLSSPDQLDQYASVIATALTQGVTTFESSAVEPGGEDALAHAYAAARNQVEREGGDVKSTGRRTTVLARFGYRTTTTTGGGGADGGDGDSSSSSIEEVSFEGDVPVGSGPAASEGCHCVHPSYVEHRLANSPLVKMRHEDGKDEMALIYAVHNPEAQGAASFGPTLSDDGDDGSASRVSSPPLDEVRQLVRERLTDSFVALEEACSNDTIDGYGVCSNGLSLPAEHPLHLNWMDVLWAASDAAERVHGKPTPPRLASLQLPANLLETNGIAVATEIRDFLQQQNRLKQPRGKDEDDTSSGGEQDNDNGEEDASTQLMVPSNSIDLCISRPLTCYSDRGTGTGHPFKLVDYRIDTGLLSDDEVDGSSNGKQWTHLMGEGRPPSYVQALNAAMGHFDAESILEEQKSRKLTVEERETLDGCRLLQSMLHDLDRNLQTVRSFAAYEEDLYQKVVPLIHDTFEGLDEDSTNVLQNFFMAHGSAVRHAIARTTRELLLEGGDGVPPYSIPADVTLQQFALQWLLGHDPSVVSKVIVGCPQPAHVLEAIQAADSLDR